MSQEKIRIPIGLDASGVSADIQKASNNVGKATAGMAKGIAAAVGQSMGPFGELIEKADAFKAALSGISTGSKIMAGAIGIAGVAAVYSVKKAVDAYQEMRKAQDEATESAERLAAAQANIGKTIKGGIAEGQQGRARANVEGQIADLEKENAATVTDAEGNVYGATESRKAQNNAKIAELRKLITSESLDASVAAGEARLGEAALTPAARKAMEEESFKAAASKLPTTDLEGLRQKRAFLGQKLDRLQGQPRTQHSAEVANKATEERDQLDRLIKALEEKSKAEEDFTKSYLEAGEVKDDTAASRSAMMPTIPGASPYQVPTGYGVGGYTSTGGGGNIFGNTAGMSDRIRTINENVKIIADAAKAKTDQPQFLTQ